MFLQKTVVTPIDPAIIIPQSEENWCSIVVQSQAEHISLIKLAIRYERHNQLRSPMGCFSTTRVFTMKIHSQLLTGKRENA